MGSECFKRLASAKNMKVSQLALLLLYAAAMGVGQILFKSVALHDASRHISFTQKILYLTTNATFIFAIGFYAFLTLVWIWILSFIPLSRAFPFTFMSVLVAGAGGHLIFGEPISGKFLFGVGMIGLGLLFLSLE